jgi:hypothetical protein
MGPTGRTRLRGFCAGVARLAAPLCAAAASAAVPAPANALAPLPRSDYAVRPVCAAPAPGDAACLALELLPRTPAARARTHPLGMRAAHAIAAGSPAQGAYGFGPQQLRNAYFPGEEPRAPASQPQTIALVDPYNDLDAEADLAVYDEAFSLPACTTANGCFEQVNANGESGTPPFPSSLQERHQREMLCEDPNAPEPEREAACETVALADGWALETSLDIETARAICQNCRIALVEAQDSARTSLEAAEQGAARARSSGGVGATEISDSWGSAQPPSDSEAFNHPGVVITAASGDLGYRGWRAIYGGGGSGVAYPASSSHVVAVGGTSLTLTGEGGQAWGSESVWGGSGGGCSTSLAAPAWQPQAADWSAVGCGTGAEATRAANDVAADADPYTGVAVYDSVPYLSAGQPPRAGSPPGWAAIGGTSAAAPIVAAMFALAGGAHGVAYPAQILYSHLGSALLHDIAEGGNGACEGFYEDGCHGALVPLSPEDCGSGALICNAAPGYDGPSGVGTPDGIAALAPAHEPTHGAGSPEAPLTEACGEPAAATAAPACGTLDPLASATVGYHFAYNRGSSCLGGRETTSAPAAPREHAAVSAQLLGLEPATEYAYCLVATNASGETAGAPIAFTTAALAPRPPTTLAPAQIAAETATLEGRLTAQRTAASWYFEYAPGAACGGPGAARTAETPDARPAEANAVRAPVSGLQPGAEYAACLVAKNAVGATAGSPLAFTTKALAPRVLSVTATAGAGAGEATIAAHVLPGASHVSCELQYGTTATDDIHVPCGEAPGGAVDTAGVHLTGLEPATEYHYRLVLENAGGKSAPGEGAGTFTTQAPTPAVSAESVSQVSASGALLAGAVAPDGARARYWFEYGESEALGQRTPGGELPAAAGTVQVTPEAISGLEPGTLYHYRLRVIDRWREALGETQTFTTASVPTSPGGGGSAPPGAPGGSGASGAGPGGAGPSGLPGAPLTPPALLAAPPQPTKHGARNGAKCRRAKRRPHRGCPRRPRPKPKTRWPASAKRSRPSHRKARSPAR